MTAASSGDPGGSGRRLPTYMDPTNEFGELTFLQLVGKNDTPLPKNPFLIGLSVEKAAGGPIEGASTEARGTRYTLRIRNPAQVEKLMKLTQLTDGTEIVVQPHPNLNFSRCVISCYEIIDMEENDVLKGLTSQGVVRAQRITRNENGERRNTPAVILTFSRCAYPSRVKIGLLSIPTRPYYPNPLLCYGCCQYGHQRARCPGSQRCLNCSAEQHVEEDAQCSEASHCINCGGPHKPNNRQCPIYKQEMEVIRLKVDRNLTYPEARKQVQANLGSYAAAAAQQSADQQRLNELEKRMKEKDSKITELLEAIKKKDEKIDKLLAYIKTTRAAASHATSSTQATSTSQSFKEPRAGPSMQLRTRSPAVTEPKFVDNGKKSKKRNKTNNTSPGRQSPPLKKSSAEQNSQLDIECLNTDEDSELEETQPSQRIR